MQDSYVDGMDFFKDRSPVRPLAPRFVLDSKPRPWVLRGLYVGWVFIRDRSPYEAVSSLITKEQ